MPKPRKREPPKHLRKVVALSAEQRAAMQKLLGFPKMVQTLGGYAGTGKTTLIKELKRQLPQFAVCAFTGKAADVLRRKGVLATTIHSLIYEVYQKTYRDSAGRLKKTMAWRKIPEALFWPSGVIVDEASMVSEVIYKDLVSFGVPLIFVGDHGQLEPVADKFALMKKPDVTLETIHRNAGPIARFAEFLRKGGNARAWKPGAKVRFLTADEAFDTDVDEWDQWIVAFNRLRVSLNKAYRETILGEHGDTPIVGDRVMCLQNCGMRHLFNGMQGEVGAVKGPEIRFDVRGQEYWVEYVPEQFNSEKAADYAGGKKLPFDFCYAVTCHKSQGDEFDRVLVFEQRCRFWDHVRWAYTAASRARERLDWVLV